MKEWQRERKQERAPIPQQLIVFSEKNPDTNRSGSLRAVEIKRFKKGFVAQISIPLSPEGEDTDLIAQTADYLARNPERMVNILQKHRAYVMATFAGVENIEPFLLNRSASRLVLEISIPFFQNGMDAAGEYDINDVSTGPEEISFDINFVPVVAKFEVGEGYELAQADTDSIDFMELEEAKQVRRQIGSVLYNMLYHSKRVETFYGATLDSLSVNSWANHLLTRLAVSRGLPVIYQKIISRENEAGETAFSSTHSTCPVEFWELPYNASFTMWRDAASGINMMNLYAALMKESGAEIDFDVIDDETIRYVTENLHLIWQKRMLDNQETILNEEVAHNLISILSEGYIEPHIAFQVYKIIKSLIKVTERSELDPELLEKVYELCMQQLVKFPSEAMTKAFVILNKHYLGSTEGAKFVSQQFEKFAHGRPLIWGNIYKGTRTIVPAMVIEGKVYRQSIVRDVGRLPGAVAYNLRSKGIPVEEFFADKYFENPDNSLTISHAVQFLTVAQFLEENEKKVIHDWITRRLDAELGNEIRPFADEFVTQMVKQGLEFTNKDRPISLVYGPERISFRTSTSFSFLGNGFNYLSPDQEVNFVGLDQTTSPSEARYRVQTEIVRLVVNQLLA